MDRKSLYSNRETGDAKEKGDSDQYQKADRPAGIYLTRKRKDAKILWGRAIHIRRWDLCLLLLSSDQDDSQSVDDGPRDHSLPSFALFTLASSRDLCIESIGFKLSPQQSH
jgi:hypothetical protein